LAGERDNWRPTPPLKAVFPVWSEKDAVVPKTRLQDKRHQRAWLSWETEDLDSPARWVRVKLHRVNANSCLSLGQVVIWGQFDGEIQASIQESDSKRLVSHGRRFVVPK